MLIIKSGDLRPPTNMLQYVSYIVFEIPCNILCKKIGPGWFIPATSLAFGICSFGTAFVNTYSQVCGVRFLLGEKVSIALASPDMY